MAHPWATDSADGKRPGAPGPASRRSRTGVSGKMRGHACARPHHPFCAEPDRVAAPRQRPHGACSAGWRRARRAAASCCASRTPTPNAARTRCSSGSSHELRWLGLDWDEGPDVGGPHGPYRQSERGDGLRRQRCARWRRSGQTYPCFCSPEELQLSRKAQLARGPAAALCAHLRRTRRRPRCSAAIAAGRRPAIRFRVPDHRVVEFVDRIHGPQRFLSDDIGDFVIRRADGSVSFFLGNALDDSAMGITLVLRGDDHLANTPRQLLLLEALGLPQPEYGHLPLVLAPERHAAVEARRRGEPDATCARRATCRARSAITWLRLGHACGHDGWLSTGRSCRRTSTWRAPVTPRRVSTKRSCGTGSARRSCTRPMRRSSSWLGPRSTRCRPGAERSAFVAVVKGNVLFPADVDELVAVVAQRSPCRCRRTTRRRRSPRRAGVLRSAAGVFVAAHAADFKAWTRAIAEAHRPQGREAVHAVALGADRRDARTGTRAARRA